jgi:hypothetical protein
MDVSITVKFSVIIDEDNNYRLTVEIIDATNIAKNIFLITNDGVVHGVCSPHDLITYPESQGAGYLFYRSNIVSYVLQDNNEIIKVKNAIKSSIQDLVDKWKTIGDVVGEEIWTTT